MKKSFAQMTDELLAKQNICSLCRVLFSPEVSRLTVITPSEPFTYCVKCIQKGFTILNNKQDKTPEQFALLGAFRTFLNKQKKAARG